MKEVSDQKEKADGSAARTRPTSVDEIMLRRKRKESLQNQLVQKASDHHEIISCSRKKDDAISNSTEERPMKEEPVGGAVQLVVNNLVEKVSDYRVSEEGYNRSEIVKDGLRKKEEDISSSKDENLDKEGSVGAAKPLGSDLVEKVSDDHAYEKGNNGSKKLRHEDSSRKKEDATSSSRDEGLVKPRKEDRVEAALSLGNDLVDKVSGDHASEKEPERSKKVSLDSVKDRSRKKEDATSSSREERLDKHIKKDPVDKVSGREHDRSNKLRPEERVKDNSKKKEDTISSSRKEQSMKENLVGATQLLSNNLVEKVSDYHESKRGYHRSEKLRREEHVKDRSRKKVEAISSFTEEKPTKEEESAGNRKRKAAGDGSTAKEKIVEEHRRIKKDETNSSFREEKPDKKMKKEDLAANRKISVEGEFPTTETKIRTYRDGRGKDTKMKANRERPAEKTTEKQIRPHETGREQARDALENLAGSRKRLRSLVVADIPRNENSTKPDSGKNQNGDHMKNRERNVSRRDDPGKVHSIEVSERRDKREQPKSDQSDMREKRRRSRSRDHGPHDRQKRSSPLPKAEKATSRHKRDHEERSENTVKDRSGKHHFNDNDNKMTSTVNAKSRRHSSPKSELGGYSPRKRREETSAKAASPSNVPSEKKTAKWDLPPTVTAGMFSNPGFSGLQLATQTAYPTMSDASLALLKPHIEASFLTPPARQTTSLDSVQLTESTRRMRRLYAENVPYSASEKSLIDCFNGYMLSSGSNHIKGSEPCISCIINKEKSQALVEFLTPQDASAALSLDGCSFAGSNLKIRRPKDYVETTSGELEKKEPATNALSDNVEDSSNKIFIGGFPKAISSEMLMEIVSVFGPIKAYRFVINNDLNQRCAFLEYTDGSVTPKACAGLNGMKLGGSVITAVCALPGASSVAADENPPFYGIPEHAKPLLGKPKHILKLKNLVDPEDLSSLSEPEVKEILEDVRLECARFGVIKSINIVEHESKDISGSNIDASLNQESKEMNVSVIQEKAEVSKKYDDTKDNLDLGEVVRSDSATSEDKLCEPSSVTAVETITKPNEDHYSTEQGSCEKLDGETVQGGAEIPHEEVGSAWAQDVAEISQEVGSARAQDEAENPQEVGSARAVKTRWDSGDKIEEEQDPKDVFELGCIFIEYGRPEATRLAAHSLHGRLYDNKIVKVEYVSKELYKIRFPSG